MNQLNLLSVGWYKGGIDFSVSAVIQTLDQEQYDEFRKMIIVAIGVAEDMRRKLCDQCLNPNQKGICTCGKQVTEY